MRSLGRFGEQLAAEFLSGHGMEVVGTNVVVGKGEIDILAMDGSPVFAQRTPMLLLRFVGVLLLRLAARKLVALLFQLPPRITRLEACPTRPCPASGTD